MRLPSISLGLGVTDIHFHVSGGIAVHFRHHQVESGLSISRCSSSVEKCRSLYCSMSSSVFREAKVSANVAMLRSPDGVDVSVLGHFDHRHGIYLLS